MGQIKFFLKRADYCNTVSLINLLTLLGVVKYTNYGEVPGPARASVPEHAPFFLQVLNNDDV
jgi:hypothetical protein